MIPSGSRYEDAEHAFTQCHVYNEWGYPYLADDAPNLKIVTLNRETLYRVNGLTPWPSDSQQEYYTKQDEGVQFLAFKFLSDAKRWTDIADANPKVWYPLDLTMGDYLRIPPTT